VIVTGRPVAPVAKELGLGEQWSGLRSLLRVQSAESESFELMDAEKVDYPVRGFHTLRRRILLCSLAGSVVRAELDAKA
jgi:hypothetical protein